LLDYYLKFVGKTSDNYFINEKSQQIQA